MKYIVELVSTFREVHVVEAENEEEALSKVMNGEVNAIDMITEIGDNTEFTYNIEDENEK